MAQRILCCLFCTEQPVQEKRSQEKNHKHNTERVRVDPTDGRTMPKHGRRTGFRDALSAISCTGRSVGIRGFCGASLKEDCRENDVGRHLEKLAFPVLEHRGKELWIAQEFEQCGGRLTVLPKLLVVKLPPR